MESLICVIPVVVTPNGAAPPDPDVLRAALRKKLNQGANAGEADEDEARALTWMARASRPVIALADASVAADVLDALARKLEGSPASSERWLLMASFRHFPILTEQGRTPLRPGARCR